jgi:hypothetical protein
MVIMKDTRKFEYTNTAREQYKEFMSRYIHAYKVLSSHQDTEDIFDFSTDFSIKFTAIRQRTTIEDVVHNVLNECVSHCITSNKSLDKDKNIPAFHHVLNYAKNNNLLEKNELEKILVTLIKQIKTEPKQTKTIDEKTKKLIEMGIAVCNAASLHTEQAASFTLQKKVQPTFGDLKTYIKNQEEKLELAEKGPFETIVEQDLAYIRGIFGNEAERERANSIRTLRALRQTAKKLKDGDMQNTDTLMEKDIGSETLESINNQKRVEIINNALISPPKTSKQFTPDASPKMVIHYKSISRAA